MPASTATGAINAAFLQEIKQDGQDLRELLECTQVLLIGPSWVRQPHRLLHLLEELRDQLALHFSLEETYGYGALDSERSARHGAQVRALHAQHQQLYLDICEIVEAAEQLLYREIPAAELEPLVVRFATFLGDLHEHETHENEMITQAFDKPPRGEPSSLVPRRLRPRRPR